MRRLLLHATFALVFAVTACFGQRGGMRAAPVARAPGAPRAPMAAGVPRFAAMPQSGFHTGGVRFHSCWNCVHHHSHPRYIYYPWWWRTYGYPYYGYGYGYGSYGPTMWDQSSYDSGSDTTFQRDLLRQVDELSQQVQSLQQQISDAEARGAAPAPAPVPESAPSPTSEPAATPVTSADLPTVLVFRDQRIQEVKSYAIVGQNLVVVSEQRARKIPLTEIDVAATTKLNEERGVDFQLPR